MCSRKQLDCEACYQGRLSNPLVISCNVQADEEVDSLMEDLEEMDKAPRRRGG